MKKKLSFLSVVIIDPAQPQTIQLGMTWIGILAFVVILIIIVWIIMKKKRKIKIE